MTGWDERKHRRRPAGQHGGGEFTSSPGGPERPEPRSTGLSGDALWVSGQGAARDVTPAERQAAQDWWYGRAAKYTNTYLRGGTLAAPLDDAEKREIAVFEGLVNRAPVFTRPVVLHRGVANGADPGLFGEPGSRVGQRFTDPGFVSATADESMAANAYAPADRRQVRTVVRISAPAGARALKSAPEFFGPGRAGEWDVHQEYTFPPGTVFRVDGDRVSGGVRQVSVTVEPPGK